MLTLIWLLLPIDAVTYSAYPLYSRQFRLKRYASV